MKRNTKQKQIMEQEIQEMSAHFNAEDIHRKLTEKKHEIGIATIYRFLKKLREERKLHSFTCERKIVYSRTNNDHSHYTCQKCGNITHFSVDSLDFIKKKIPGKICHFQIEVEGVCDKCAGN